LSKKCGILDVSQSYGLSLPVPGIVLRINTGNVYRNNNGAFCLLLPSEFQLLNAKFYGLYKLSETDYFRKILNTCVLIDSFHSLHNTHMWVTTMGAINT
jgi:hypothetical protein